MAKADGADSVVRIDIKTPDALQIDTGSALTTIPDAIGVGELLFHLDSDHLSAVCSLKATAGLGISADVNGSALASGGVAVDWPTVFKADSCEPDLDGLDIAADTDFDLNLKQFDPFPSVSGKHDGGNGERRTSKTRRRTSTASRRAATPTKNNFLNLTLRNKTTGGSCTITTIDATHLNCTLSGGTRATARTNNKWNDGDEYEVEGNALALIGFILDHLDELVEQIDQIDPALTEKEIPLVGISTKELVGKIQSVKQTIDELRGPPLAEIDCIAESTTCSTRADDGDPVGMPALDSLGRPFDFENLPDGTTLWCRAVSTVEPDTRRMEGPQGPIAVTPDDAFIPDGTDVGNEPDPAPLLDPADPTSDVAARSARPGRLRQRRTRQAHGQRRQRRRGRRHDDRRVADPGALHRRGREPHRRVPVHLAAAVAAGARRTRSTTSSASTTSSSSTCSTCPPPAPARSRPARRSARATRTPCRAREDFADGDATTRSSATC